MTDVYALSSPECVVTDNGLVCKLDLFDNCPVWTFLMTKSQKVNDMVLTDKCGHHCVYMHGVAHHCHCHECNNDRVNDGNM